ncbi:RNA polymerase-associated protein RapA [Pleionea litopenaei]|uniref:RNA polymerase-associated protein RapA n=1 Tax=Pleionea litopenaei TaxID=3070815 RepID=A0AA51RRX6_9GAMM|nr:RNA polymerase-associated protein RapA [Pleionea sp. HL-JVS1]WMS86447.1 RNA polymerase-associated protein RapA [Pleionea sp. HL-JVS1]
MSQVVVGQRWVSHSESNLGLGMIQSVEGRRMEIYFPAVNESRHYAIDNAPVSRIQYQSGDRISDMDDQVFQVIEAHELNGLMIYLGEDANGEQHQITELHLNCYVQFNAPEKRLLNGQIDSDDSYQLRFDTFAHLDRLQQSPVQGLLGPRVELLPHQLYIAHEVAHRPAPRVLLADEVGLGKTIEAGMIIHQQIVTGRSERVLILVPDSLVHQWLVEMLRRFNLRFALYDKPRFDALQAQPIRDLDNDEEVNPFAMEQFIIASLDGLMESPDMQQHLLVSDWDLLVVDEAHHLRWSEQASGEDYQLVEQVASRSEGVLLLTATPEQAGLDSHFARLRLLDPKRYHDLTAFKAEVAAETDHRELIEALQDTEFSDVERLKSLLPNELHSTLTDSLDESIKQKLLDQLVDQFGNGRVMFRNARSSLDNFPIRSVQSYPMPCPEIYQPEDDDPLNVGIAGLTPEVELVPDVWIKRDPRVEWLEQKLEQLSDEKVLVIAHHASTALALQQHFSRKLAVKCSCFHEGLSLIERDRAAAYFADREEGARVLFCSEIGSEGRNFQFAHHLVLFDLPANPDLVEQRIGRLDRIGQTQTINIHIPYLEGSSQHVLFDWYHKGLNLFEQSFSAGYSVFLRFEASLLEAMTNLTQDRSELIMQTQKVVADIVQQQELGRNKLLELNSCRQPQADELVEQLIENEQHEVLTKYFEGLLEEFGVDYEDHSALSWIVRPSDQMKHSYFPALKEEGTTVTLDRMKALSRDDIEFLSWEHPMVSESMEMLAKSDAGNTSVTTISVKGLKPGTLLLETFYTLESIAPKKLQLSRYVSAKPQRFLIDATGKDLSKVVSHSALNQLSQPLKGKVARQIVAQVKTQVAPMIELSHQLSQTKVADIKSHARSKLNEALNGEIERLRRLRERNSAIREDEITRLEQQIQDCERHIEKAQLQLQGIKLVIAS